jgi:hypothetical protein
MPPDRAGVARRFRAHLEAHGYPRLAMFVLVSLAGMVGFLVSFALLAAGMTSMPARYAIAGTAAYLGFLALLAVYIAWKRRLERALDAADIIDVHHFVDPFPRGEFASGGDSHALEPGGADGSSWLDADLGWVLLAIAAAAAGLVAIGWIVWAAPALLAEVLVDALIVSAVSSKLAHAERRACPAEADRRRRDWTMTAIRRTWLAAAVVIVTLVVAGWSLQHLAPDAVSIGPAVRAIAGG